MRDLRRYKWTLQYIAFVVTVVLLVEILDMLGWRLQ